MTRRELVELMAAEVLRQHGFTPSDALPADHWSSLDDQDCVWIDGDLDLGKLADAILLKQRENAA